MPQSSGPLGHGIPGNPLLSRYTRFRCGESAHIPVLVSASVNCLIGSLLIESDDGPGSTIVIEAPFWRANFYVVHRRYPFSAFFLVSGKFAGRLLLYGLIPNPDGEATH